MTTAITDISNLEPYIEAHTAFAITDNTGREHYYYVEQIPGTIVYRVFASRSGHSGRLVGTVHRYDRLTVESPYRQLGTQYEPAPTPSRDTTLYGHWAALLAWMREPGAPSRQLGYCRRCGRLLTTPRAIARGYGDECYSIVHKHGEVTVTAEPCDTCYYRYCTDDDDLLCYSCPVGLTFLDGCSSCDCQRRHREMEQTGHYKCDMYRPRKGANDAK